MDKKELNLQDYDLKTHFIDYWDQVVRQWLEKDAVHESFTGNAEEQHQIIKAINNSVGKTRKYKLNTDHMPEPYWGNPKECSIVLLDYNPAGGSQPSSHTSIKDKDGDISFVHYVNTHSYSDFALQGPVFRDDNDFKKNGFEWFTHYGGYGWWQEKRRWLGHLLEANLNNKKEKLNDKLPFGMELCGWHSEKWSNNMSWIDNGCRDIVNQRAIKPFFESLKRSDAKMAVCIGAEFKYELLKKFFVDRIEDITKELSTKIEKSIKIGDFVGENKKTIYRNLTYSAEYEKDNIHVVANWGTEKKRTKQIVPDKPKQRNYRVFKITEGEDVYYILNTNTSGSNSHPGEHFWSFEKVLIKEIKKMT